jgi:hypothetical protein
MKDKELPLLGWKEWVALPDFGIPALKAKLDTGAKTSALHAFVVEPVERDGCACVRIGIHPLQKRSVPEVWCVAPIADRRWIRDSGGHCELRYIVETTVRIGNEAWRIETSLTDRDNMLFRFILGRAAIVGRYIVDPAQSYVTGRVRARR